MVHRANVVDGDTENVDSDLRERPFNLKRGYGFFPKKYSDFGGGKKKSDSEFLSYNLMLNTGKISRFARQKKIF
jgi:hypothetical protein